MKALVRWLLDLIYPPKCMLCRRLLESSDQILCLRCGFDLPEWEGPLRKVPYYEKAVAPFYYKGTVRDAILRFKFHGMQPYARQFAQWMAVWVRDHLQGQFELITWVPCSRRRRWSRGFDQAQLLAKALGEELAVPVFRTLEKVKHNPKQSTIADGARRRANVLGVYRAVQPERFSGKRILVVDDVLTTGSTLAECGKVLRIAGSGDLVCAVIAAAGQEKE